MNIGLGGGDAGLAGLAAVFGFHGIAADPKALAHQNGAGGQAYCQDDLAEAEQKAARLQGDLVEAERLACLQTLTESVAGTVQQLAVHALGSVVTSAEGLRVILPAGTSLENRGDGENSDIRFVYPGETAAIEADTVNFTRYRMLPGGAASGHVL